MGFRTQGELEKMKCKCGQRLTNCVLGTGRCMAKSIQKKRTLKLDKNSHPEKKSSTFNLITKQSEKST